MTAWPRRQVCLIGTAASEEGGGGGGAKDDNRNPDDYIAVEKCSWMKQCRNLRTWLISFGRGMCSPTLGRLFDSRLGRGAGRELVASRVHLMVR